MNKNALVIGNSDGIGLATTKELLKRGWRVAGISRSASPIRDAAYEHHVMDVRDRQYRDRLQSIIEENDPVGLCIYCAGIGELLDVADMDRETDIVDVNLLGMIRTACRAIPPMVRRGEGHFIGISSLADRMPSAEAPSYHASKAGFSNYLESLALALKPKGVHVSNVRFGFVDTKMAKGEIRPFMMGTDRAAAHMMACIEKKPVRYTAPWIAVPLVKFRAWILGLHVLLG